MTSSFLVPSFKLNKNSGSYFFTQCRIWLPMCPPCHNLPTSSVERDFADRNWPSEKLQLVKAVVFCLVFLFVRNEAESQLTA